MSSGTKPWIPGCRVQLLRNEDPSKVEEGDGDDGHADGDNEPPVVAHLDEAVDRVLQGEVRAVATVITHNDLVEADEDEDHGDQTEET